MSLISLISLTFSISAIIICIINEILYHKNKASFKTIRKGSKAYWREYDKKEMEKEERRREKQKMDDDEDNRPPDSYFLSKNVVIKE